MTQIIEQNMKGLDRLLYMISTSETEGAVKVNLTFENGADPDIAQVQVQNKLQLAVPRCPRWCSGRGFPWSNPPRTFCSIVGLVC